MTVRIRKILKKLHPGLVDVTVPVLCLPCLLSYLLEDYFYICSSLPDPPPHTHTSLLHLCLNHTSSVFQVESMCAVCVCARARLRVKLMTTPNTYVPVLRSGTCFYKMNMQVIFYAHTGCKTISHNISATDGPSQPYWSIHHRKAWQDGTGSTNARFFIQSDVLDMGIAALSLTGGVFRHMTTASSCSACTALTPWNHSDRGFSIISWQIPTCWGKNHIWSWLAGPCTPPGASLPHLWVIAVHPGRLLVLLNSLELICFTYGLVQCWHGQINL